MKKLRLGIVGCGRLNRIVAEAVADGLLPEYELVGCYSRTYESAEKLAAAMAERGIACKPCHTIEELLEQRPDIVAEAATPAGMRAVAVKCLENGCSIVCLSIGAFADERFYAERERIEQAIACLPKYFEGHISRMPREHRIGRVGPMPIRGFYKRFLGMEHIPSTWQEWRSIPEYHLCSCTKTIKVTDLS